MRWLPVIVLAVCFALTAQPAHAGPLVGIISGIIGVIKGSTVLTAIFKLVGSVVLSKLAAKLAPKPRQPGIKTDITQTGTLAPCSFTLGTYATDGVHVCPPRSYGTSGQVQNAFLTYVIELGDVPGPVLQGVWVDGVYVDHAGTPAGNLGLLITSPPYANRMWINYHDGSQTTVDAFLQAQFGAASVRPWSSAMVGRGIPYVVLNFLFDPAIFKAFPTCRFVMGGVPLYDPRLDGTAGGVGPQRWNNKATWAPSDNPQVQLYNLHRGIDVAGHVWGGRDDDDALPTDWWFAAMNACDTLVDDGDGGTEPQFRAGFEVFTVEEPAAVGEELLKASLAQVADMGGRWLVAVADAGLPVYALTDDDLIATLGGDKSEFPAPQDTFNAISANFPFPDQQWEPAVAPMLLNAGWEAEDGQRLPVSIDYPAVPHPAQVQRLMAATIASERRFLTHSEPLPPEAMALDLLDALTWTSDQYGYAAKLFQIGRLIEDLKTGIVTLHMRERDPDDVAVVPGYFTPPQVVSSKGDVSGGIKVTRAFGPAGWQVVSPSIVIDDTDTTWVNVRTFTVVGQPGYAGLQQFMAGVEAELAGGGSGVLLWRMRIFTPGPANTPFSRADTLVSGIPLALVGSGPTEVGDGLNGVAIDVNGSGLTPGQTVTVTAIQYRVFSLIR